MKSLRYVCKLGNGRIRKRIFKSLLSYGFIWKCFTSELLVNWVTEVICFAAIHSFRPNYSLHISICIQSSIRNQATSKKAMNCCSRLIDYFFNSFVGKSLKNRFLLCFLVLERISVEICFRLQSLEVVGGLLVSFLVDLNNNNRNKDLIQIKVLIKIFISFDFHSFQSFYYFKHVKVIDLMEQLER